jgi:hypothetical protein
VEDRSPVVDGTAPDPARRRFTRNALVGSAVIVSLGNRAAWGYTGNNVGACMSGPTLASFATNGNTFASFNPNHDETVAQDIVDLLGNTGPIGNRHSVCPDGTGGYCITDSSCDSGT